MTAHSFDPNEWEKCLGQMIRYHQNISDEIRNIIIQIRKEMNQDLVPKAEERANYGKIVKKAIRSMWALEYEIEDIQVAFAKQLGDIDLDNLTDDFVEDALLQSKPLQGVLFEIRVKQKLKMDEVKKEYEEHISGLEPLKIPRPPKPQPKPEEPEKKEEEKKEEGEKKEEEKKPDGGENEIKPEEVTPSSEDVPPPAMESNTEPPVVEASA